MKRFLILIPLSLIILFLYGADTLVHATLTEIQERKSSCDNVDGKMKRNIKQLAEVFIQNDLENLKNRINKLLSSMEKLVAEKNLVEDAICVDVVNEETILPVKMNVYHSLLVYAIKMKEKEDIQFDGITLESLDNESLVQLEAILQDSGREVHIDHYYSYHASSAYFQHNVRIEEEKLKQIEEGPSSFVNAITNGLASSTYEVIQNPIEKFIMMVDRYFTGKSEKELKLFREKAVVPSMTYDVSFSIIISDISDWKQLYMTEYYLIDSTYYIFDRAKEIRQEIPNYWYPAEAIENENWNEVIEYYEEHRSDMIDYDRELYEYLISNILPKPMELEDLLEKAKNENDLPHLESK